MAAWLFESVLSFGVPTFAFFLSDILLEPPFLSPYLANYLANYILEGQFWSSISERKI